MVCDKGRDRGTQFFGGGDIQQKGKVKTFSLAGGDVIMWFLIQQFPLCLTPFSPFVKWGKSSYDNQNHLKFAVFW